MLLDSNGWSGRRGDLKVLLQSDECQSALLQLLFQIERDCGFLVLLGGNIERLDDDASAQVEIAFTPNLLP
jgi:hypothetical protein